MPSRRKLQPPNPRGTRHLPEEVTALFKEYFNNVSNTPTADQYAALLDELRGFPGMEDSRRDTVKTWFKRQRRLALRARVVPKASAVSQPQHSLVYQSLTPDVLKNLDNVWTSVPANKRHQLYDHWTNVAYCNVGANPDDVAHWLLDRERAEAQAGAI